jgi:hypothetical protein
MFSGFIFLFFGSYLRFFMRRTAAGIFLDTCRTEEGSA